MQPLVAEYDNMLRCIRCAACLTACPTYVVTHKEEEGPRGRIAIMRAIVEGHLEVTPDAIEHLDNCVLCEACTNVCPAGVQMESIGVAFRESLAATRPAGGRSWPVRFAFGWLFGDLAHFRLLGRLIWLYQQSGVQWLARHSGMLRVLGLQAMESMLPNVPAPGRFVVPKGQTVGQGKPAHVFAGCIMSTAFAATTDATTRLVAAFGCQAELSHGQVCCGALQLHAGDVERARELALQNVAAFGDGDAPIVVNAAGCGAMLKHYAQLLPDEPRAAAMAARVRDVSEFLAEHQPIRAPREVRLTVALQDACHLLHAQRISAAPRTLLRSIPGLEVREMPEAEICCGSGAMYNVSHPAMSAELQQRKCANIAATGSKVVVTGNPGCFVQLQAGLPADIRVRHIVDVLAEAYLE